MIIGLAGEKRSGKSTLANMLKRKYRFKVMAFAEPLKVALSETFNIPLDDFETDVKEEKFEPKMITEADLANFLDYISDNYLQIDAGLASGVSHQFKGIQYSSIRELMQIMGTEVVRDNVSESYWIDYALKRVKSSQTDIVFSDARFPNERALIKQLHGYTVKIKRPIQSTETHRSETLMGDDNEYDMVILNDDSKSRLEFEFDIWYGFKQRSRR